MMDRVRLVEIIDLRLKKYEGLPRGNAAFDDAEIKRINLENADVCFKSGCGRHRVDNIGAGTSMVHCEAPGHGYKFMVSVPLSETAPVAQSNNGMTELYK